MRDPHAPLTEEEQRRLEALEAALTEEDPRLARRLRSARRIPLLGVVLGGPPSRGWVAVVLLGAGSLDVLLSLLVSTGVAFAGCLAIAAGAYLALTCHRAVRMFRRLDAWFVDRVLPSADTRRSDE